MPLQQAGGGKPPEISDDEPAELAAAEITDSADWNVINGESVNIKAQISSVDTSDAD